ncbi:MAG: Rdx family protein [Verrucomicrobia bacterium]|nr:Rdx family protein [Verrucomicrobiota bacterium]
MTARLLDEFKPDIQSLTLVPGTGGVFEVSVNGTKIFSKLQTGKFPEPDDIVKAIRAKL